MDNGINSRVPYRNQATPPISPVHLPPSPTLSPNSSVPHWSLSPDGSSGSNGYRRDRDEYPESPTRRSYGRRASSGRPLISLDDDHDSDIDENHKSRKTQRPFSLFNPRKWRMRMTKRRLTMLLLLGLIGFLARGWISDVYGKYWKVARRKALSTLPPGILYPVKKAMEEEGEYEGCQFVSTMEAYYKDLERLRKQVALRQNISLSHIDSSSPSSPRRRSPSASKHLFSSTGHLLVSDMPGSSHPIPQLIEKGEEHWQSLIRRQSTTLAEAVREYERRYGRRPPVGFDVWWEFVMDSGVILVDEYDRINLDLAPFFALPKSEIRKRLLVVENMKETFTLVVKGGEVKVEIKDKGGLGWQGTLPRAEDAADLVQSFAHLLPDMKATFSIFDQPQVYISWARRSSLVDLGLRNLHTSHLSETDVGHVDLSRSCSPQSNLRTNPFFAEGKSFIYDTIEAADMCQNPYLVNLHGLTLEPHEQHSHPRPHTQLLPLFSLAKTSINSDILITPLDQFFDPIGNDPPWERKKSDKLAWRGSTTGISMMTQDLPWRSSHRIRLHHFANNKSMIPNTYLVPDLGQSDIPSGTGQPMKRGVADLKETLKFDEEEAWTRVASHFFFDMKLAGRPLQCDEDDGTCEDLEREINFAPYQSPNKLNEHKFLLDIDGNGWSGRFRSTNSLVIKTGLFTEWFQPHLIPWYMYIPSKLDFSDLTDILAFFRGSPRNPDLGFDETAKAIASNGKCFAERMFRLEDMQAYMLRLFLEFARLTADEGVDMDFYHDEGAFAAKHRMKESTGTSAGEEEMTPEGVQPLDVSNRMQHAQSEFEARKDKASDTASEDYANFLIERDNEEKIALEQMMEEEKGNTFG